MTNFETSFTISLSLLTGKSPHFIYVSVTDATRYSLAVVIDVVWSFTLPEGDFRQCLYYWQVFPYFMCYFIVAYSLHYLMIFTTIDTSNSSLMPFLFCYSWIFYMFLSFHICQYIVSCHPQYLCFCSVHFVIYYKNLFPFCVHTLIVVIRPVRYFFHTAVDDNILLNYNIWFEHIEKFDLLRVIRPNYHY